MKLCSYCGKQLTPDASYCNYCGTEQKPITDNDLQTCKDKTLNNKSPEHTTSEKSTKHNHSVSPEKDKTNNNNDNTENTNQEIQHQNQQNKQKSDNSIVCKHCGAPLLPPGANFCGACGKPQKHTKTLVPTVPIATIENLNCKSCGNAYTIGDFYCIQCGSYLGTRKTDTLINQIQNAISTLIDSQKWLSFLAKYAMIFACIYPVCNTISNFYSLSSFSSFIYTTFGIVFLSIVSYFCLILMFSKEHYLQILLLMVFYLFSLISYPLFCGGTFQLYYIWRIALIAVVFYYCFKRYKASGQKILIMKEGK